VDTPWMEMQLNSDTASNYSDTEFYGTGSTVSNARQTGSGSMRIAYPLNSTSPSLVELDLFSYSGSTNKTVLSRGSNDLNGSGNVWRSVGLWRNTAAINSIKLIAPGGNNFYAGAKVSLYGIKNA